MTVQPTCPDDGPSAADVQTRQRIRTLLICAALVLAVELVFGQTLRFDFVNLDDDKTVYENYSVRKGLTWQGIVWAFSEYHFDSSSPLSTVSHMVDCELFGLNPRGHHLVNLVLHAANAVLLFLVLRWMTDSVWPSAFVAAVFAVHPLHVESVAWVTERKDVLSGLFFMLALGAYVGYVRRRHWVGWYVATVILFALGLLAKPAVITFPFVLLLLDYWPLGRMVQSSRHTPCAVADGTRSVPATGLRLPFATIARLTLEKLPLFALVPLSCVWTIWGQGTNVEFPMYLPWSWRIANALMSYVTYLEQSLYPVELTVMYPPRGFYLPFWHALPSLVLLIGITATAYLTRRNRPYLLVGWLWYLGMLAPVMGLVPFGAMSAANRFTYLPQIGLAVALAWGAADVCRRWPGLRWPCGIVSTLVLAALAVAAWRQTSVWRNDDTLYTHALACNPGHVRVHNHYGYSLLCRGQLDAAMTHFQRALKNDRRFAPAHHNIGCVWAARGQWRQAIASYRKALAIDPDSFASLMGLAWLLAVSPDPQLRNGQEAIELAQRARRFDDKVSYGQEADVLRTLAAAYAESGRFSEAVATAGEAINLAKAGRNQVLVGELQAQIALYAAGKPYHLPPPPPAPKTPKPAADHP